MSDSVLPPGFDADGPAAPSGGLFGLPTTVDQARVVVVPVPFEGTVTYGNGAAEGPAAILEASRQVDLFDADTGKPYEQGIAMLDIPAEVRDWSRQTREFADPIIRNGGPGKGPEWHALQVGANALCGFVNDWVYSQVDDLTVAGKLCVVLGGDHSAPFGALQALGRYHHSIGILHIDAHYDLREAYHGLTWSHASIMWNVLEHVQEVTKVVHVGVRDYGEREHRMARADERCVGYLESEVRDRLGSGVPWRSIVDEMIEHLPHEVYVSFDIDGLDPSLCPGTGTPVPGGLSFHEATSLLAAVVRSGRRIIGADLCEVAPSKGDREWNANVGARVLYKLIGYALKSQA